MGIKAIIYPATNPAICAARRQESGVVRLLVVGVYQGRIHVSLLSTISYRFACQWKTCAFMNLVNSGCRARVGCDALGNGRLSPASFLSTPPPPPACR